MPNMLYTKNSMINRNIAIAILWALLLSNLGILQSIGLNLAVWKIGSWTYLQLLATLGNVWIIYGLTKNELG